ncbi:hypothetical protein AVEN_209400-1 [Araneus ventricosus]|uniref:Uncharacterized protein n=1 Tax=Araneus ventricosus TaxID=182803 RepID=A0A4Y2JMG3_ARAVE|nr:hypothetical protein AVEN_209400-1 [Araneus ventricosus]
MGLLWDQEMPQIMRKLFKEWCRETEKVNSVTIPRFYHFTDLCVIDIQLHSFSDASKKAYGTVVYFLVVRPDGTITTSFVTSKSRVAPLKTLSLPRLELMGALLSARLCDKVSKTLKFGKSCFFHTDSSIVYHWIQGEPARFKPFVKNSVEEILRLTEPLKWNHCPGRENPADILRRGISVKELNFGGMDHPGLDKTNSFGLKLKSRM